jgi:hypothetical protein
MYLQGLAKIKRNVGKSEGEVQRGRPEDNIKMNEVFAFWDVTQR